MNKKLETPGGDIWVSTIANKDPTMVQIDVMVGEHHNTRQFLTVEEAEELRGMLEEAVSTILKKRK